MMPCSVDHAEALARCLGGQICPIRRRGCSFRKLLPPSSILPQKLSHLASSRPLGLKPRFRSSGASHTCALLKGKSTMQPHIYALVSRPASIEELIQKAKTFVAAAKAPATLKA